MLNFYPKMMGYSGGGGGGGGGAGGGGAGGGGASTGGAATGSGAAGSGGGIGGLRVDNVCGEGGRNALNGSVYFNRATTDYLQIGSAGDHNYLHDGTEDFSVEFWVFPTKSSDRQTIFSTGGNSDSTGFACRIMEDGASGGSNGTKVLCQFSRGADGNYLGFLGGTVDINSWSHIALQFTTSNKQLKIYVNGILTNSSDLDGTANGTFGSGNFSSSNSTYAFNIGREPYGNTLYLDGAYISNLRICRGHIVYSSEFTPPSSPLSIHYTNETNRTTILCCQNSEDSTQEATGKTITANGSTDFSHNPDNLIKNGRFTVSASAEWTLTGGTAVLGTGQSGTFNDGNHLVLTASSSYAYLKQAFTTKIGRTYRVNCQSNGADSSFISTTSSESDAIITDIRSTVQTTDGRVAEKNFVATQTTYYMILRGGTGAGNFDTASAYEEKATIPPKILPPFGTDNGVTFDGAISMNSSDYMCFPTGRTEERGRGRGIFHGGYNNPGSGSYNAALSEVEIASDGVTSKFGDLTQARYMTGTVGSSTRSVFVAGAAPVSPNPFFSVNTIDYVTIASKGNAQDFGDTLEVGYLKTGVSSGTRGVYTEGRIYNPSAGTGSNTIEYITIASSGNGLNFGDLVGGGRTTLCNAAMSPTRGILAGGILSPVPDTTNFTNIIEYVTMASLGNSVNFGDLQKSGGRSGGNCSSSTRGVFSIGTQSPADGNTIEFVTIATTGNALDFGDLSGGMQMRGACSNKTRGLFAGGFVAPGSANYVNTCEKITIATTGNATDWGDTFEGVRRAYNSGISDSHGGL